MPDLTDAEFNAALAALKTGEQNDALDRVTRRSETTSRLKSIGERRRQNQTLSAAIASRLKNQKEN